MKRLIYTGKAAGQARTVKIGGRQYTRGDQLTVTNELALVLMDKGGFEEQKPLAVRPEKPKE